VYVFVLVMLLVDRHSASYSWFWWGPESCQPVYF